MCTLITLYHLIMLHTAHSSVFSLYVTQHCAKHFAGRISMNSSQSKTSQRTLKLTYAHDHLFGPWWKLHCFPLRTHKHAHGTPQHGCNIQFITATHRKLPVTKCASHSFRVFHKAALQFTQHATFQLSEWDNFSVCANLIHHYSMSIEQSQKPIPTDSVALPEHLRTLNVGV